MMMLWCTGSKHLGMWRLAWTAALGLALVLLMSGCSEDPTPAPPAETRQPVEATIAPTATPTPTAIPTPTPTATPTPTPPTTLTLQDQLLQELVALRAMATATAPAATPIPTRTPTPPPTPTPTPYTEAIPVSFLEIPRFEHQALLLDDGRVLASGGFTRLCQQQLHCPVPPQYY